MSKVPYSKQSLTYDQQILQLQQRRLVIEDTEKAAHLLEHISYYRLSGYWYPLLEDKEAHVFKQGATFNAAFMLYCFDKELRKLVLSELEKIEVAVRAKIIYELSHAYGPFWFQDQQHFRNPATHARTLVKITDEYIRSDEEFITAFKRKYTDPLPPSWITMEITSFGSLSMLYSCLSPGLAKRAVAGHFGLPDTVFQTWLHSIVYLRNICAHHSRLWNRVMSIAPQIPRKPRKIWLSDPEPKNNRTWFMLCVIKYLLQTINPKAEFGKKLNGSLAAYPTVDTAAMGFPANWREEELWK